MKTKPYKYNAAQRAWLKDLETTRAKQYDGFLHAIDAAGKTIGFCCLGRACVTLKVKPIAKPDAEGKCYLEQDQLLPMDLVSKLKLRSNEGKMKKGFDGYFSLIDLNDLGNFTFKQIAAEIRKNPRNFFKD